MDTYITILQKILYLIIQWPVKTWTSLPPWIRITTYTIILILSITLAIIAIKNKNTWMNKIY